MPRHARELSNSGIYHIILRGINRQTIFNDDEDYQRFINTLKKYKTVSGYTLYAYCLMNNHIHILLRVGQEKLETILKRIAGSYVYWYNFKYNRIGHLFQDRFKSEPVDSDEYFLTVLRYIHQNPIKARICERLEDYRYSSYVDYLNNRNDFTCIDFACSILGRNDFFEFNNEINDDKCLDAEEKRRLTDKDGMEILQQMLKGKPVEVIVDFEEKDKAALISKMKSEGLSIRQISRLTGVSIGIVRKY